MCSPNFTSPPDVQLFLRCDANDKTGVSLRDLRAKAKVNLFQFSQFEYEIIGDLCASSVSDEGFYEMSLFADD